MNGCGGAGESAVAGGTIGRALSCDAAGNSVGITVAGVATTGGLRSVDFFADSGVKLTAGEPSLELTSLPFDKVVAVGIWAGVVARTPCKYGVFAGVLAGLLRGFGCFFSVVAGCAGSYSGGV